MIIIIMMNNATTSLSSLTNNGNTTDATKFHKKTHQTNSITTFNTHSKKLAVT
jgi:hypothetical protein